jgi:hypothetical protein
MLTPMMGNKLPERRTWAADTGCFAAPERYDTAAYLAWLRDRRSAAPRCLFATAPDVVGDAAATLERATPVLPMIRAEGYPAALVAQDGLESLDVPWNTFDCLFIGGTTAWKLSEAAYGLIAAAKAREKHVHVGRVNSLRRLRTMAIAGVDSADGTFLAFGPDANLPRLAHWLRALKIAPTLPLFAVGLIGDD